MKIITALGIILICILSTSALAKVMMKFVDMITDKKENEK